MSQITSVTAATRSALPAPCISCVFWQHDRLVSDERHKAAWAESFGRRHGAFGRVLRDGPAFRGMVQFGPADAFPRALALPAGPPSRDAALITCTFLEGEDPEGSCERLLLEALADLKAREVVAVEAFALAYDDDVSGGGALPRPPHALRSRLPRGPRLLARCARRGDVSLMRIELGGLVRGPGLVSQAMRLVRGAAEPRMRGAPA